MRKPEKALIERVWIYWGLAFDWKWNSEIDSLLATVRCALYYCVVEK